MPQYGICLAPDQAAPVKAAGWDYVEGHVQNLFQGFADDAAWTGESTIRSGALPTPVANCLVPGDLRIVGPTVNAETLTNYMARTIARAGKCGTTTLVFGSGVARNVPAGFDRARAREQILEFSRMSADIAAGHGVTLVFEPLNRGECNIINSVSEAMEYVTALSHPNMQCLVDSYHFWLEDEPLQNLADAMKWIRHVHVADKDGRVAPGQSGTADYRPFFKVLKAGGYDRRISVEVAKFMDAPASYPIVLQFLKKQWAEA